MNKIPYITEKYVMEFWADSIKRWQEINNLPNNALVECKFNSDTMQIEPTSNFIIRKICQ